MKISGLDTLTRQLDEAQKAMEALDGELGEVSFNPTDPGSIETAIQQVEAIVDGRISQWANNTIVSDLAAEMKAKYREAIIDRAAAARLEGPVDDGN